MDSFINRLRFSSHRWGILCIYNREFEIARATVHSLHTNFSLIWRVTLNSWAGYCGKVLVSWPRTIGLFTCHRISWDFTRKFNRLGHMVSGCLWAIFVDIMNGLINCLLLCRNRWSWLRRLWMNIPSVRFTAGYINDISNNIPINVNSSINSRIRC